MSFHWTCLKDELGQLVHDGHCVRFFAGAEIAVTLGAVCPVLLDRDRRLQNRGLGIAISVPHAATGLLMCAAVLKVPGLPSPQKVLSFFQQRRMRNDNALFVPSGADWFLCPRDRLPDLLQHMSGTVGITGRADLSSLFVPVTLQAPDEAVTLQVACGALLQDVFTFLGIADLCAELPAEWGPKTQAMTVRVHALPSLTDQGLFAGVADSQGMTLWLTSGQAYLMHTKSPLFWPQVVHIVDQLALGSQDSLALYLLNGLRLPSWDPALSCCLACAEGEDQQLFPLSHWASLQPVFDITGPAEVQLQVEGDVAAVKAWLGMPYHVAFLAGWQTQVQGFPPTAPDPVVLRFVWSRTSCGRGGLMQRTNCRTWRRFGGQPLAPVQCHLGESFRALSPAHVTVLSLRSLQLLIRRSAINRAGFSSRFTLTWLGVGLRLRMGNGLAQGLPRSASARVALLMLPRHLSTSCWLRRVLARSWQLCHPGRKLLDGRKSSPSQLLMGCQPPSPPRVMPEQLTEGPVEVEQGFFVNEDNTPTNIIDHISPGATGLVLVDFAEAAQLCSSLEGVQPDELAILVLGHACPDAHSCDGALSFPAESADGSRKVLLAGCLRNFEGKKVRGMHATKAEVELSDVTCCQFMVFSDEVEATQWKLCVDAPVRFVADILRRAGVQTSFSGMQIAFCR